MSKFVKRETFLSFSSQATKRMAADLARRLLIKKRIRGPIIIGLTGALGSGKTTFVQGFIRSLGIKKRITSPTFLVFKPYSLPRKYIPFKKIYHIDLYRINSAKEVLKLGLMDILKNPSHIVLIEWAGKIRRALPKTTIKIAFYHSDKVGRRRILMLNN